MLLDRGLLAEEGSSYRVTGEVESLEVPETLQALVAARLDGLGPDERRLIGDAAVLGKTFTRGALAQLTEVAESELEGLLGGLVRKEVLGLQSDPRSPEHGQYGFLQTCSARSPTTRFRSVSDARSTSLRLSICPPRWPKKRWPRWSRRIWSRLRLSPDEPDADALRARAQDALMRAGERAASLGASTEAQRYFEQAADLAASPGEEAPVLLRAGEMALAAGSFERAGHSSSRRSRASSRRGRRTPPRGTSSWLGLVDQNLGRTSKASCGWSAPTGDRGRRA